MKVDAQRLSRNVEFLLLLLAGFAVLWKGGKSLEATWLLAGFAAILPFVATGSGRLGKTISGAAVCFLALSIASQLTSSAFNYGWDELLRDAGCLLIFAYVARSSIKGFPFRFSRVVTGVAVLACLAGIAVYSLQPVSRFVGTFLDWRFRTDYWPNAWAEFLLLAWPCAAYALRRRPVVLGAALGLFLGCLLLSYSRAGFLALLGQLLLLGILGIVSSIRMRSWPKGETVVRWWSVVGLMAMVCTVVFVGTNALRSSRFSVESVRDKATFNAAEGTSSVSERRDFWTAAVRMTAERPLLGWGPYSFRFVQPRYQTSVLATSDHPHNVFLKIASERGIPALLAFVTLLASILGPTAWRLARRTVRADSLEWQPLALISASGVLLHSLVDYNLQFVGIALPLWIVLGTLVSSVEGKKQRGKRIEKIAAVALLVFTLWEGMFLVTSSLARRSHAIGDDTTALLWYARSAPQLFRRDSDLSVTGIRLSRGETEEARASVRRAISLNPEDARGWLLLGNLQESRREWDPALAAYERTWMLGRYNVLNALSGLLRVSVARSQRTDLLRRHDEYLSLFNAYADAILKNTHFIAISTTVEELQHAAASLESAYPKDAPAIAKRTEEARSHAEEERARFGQQPGGLLW